MTNIDKKFATASKLGIPPYNWIPPEHPPLEETNNLRDPFPENNLSVCTELKKMEPEKEAKEEHLKDPKAKLEKLPHPGSDFKHSDPPRPNDVEDVAAYQRLRLAFNLIVCNTYQHLFAINEAAKNWYLTGDGLDAYKEAKDNYIKFLQILLHQH